jgi:hypothetical protein
LHFLQLCRWNCDVWRSLAGSSLSPLCQREWDGAHSEQQNYVKGAPNKVRLNVWVYLFFHRGAFEVLDVERLFSEKREKVSRYFS